MGVSLTNCYQNHEESKVNEGEDKKVLLRSNPKRYQICLFIF